MTHDSHENLVANHGFLMLGTKESLLMSFANVRSGGPFISSNIRS